jgi:hypothetical protein
VARVGRDGMGYEGMRERCGAGCEVVGLVVAEVFCVSPKPSSILNYCMALWHNQFNGSARDACFPSAVYTQPTDRYLLSTSGSQDANSSATVQSFGLIDSTDTLEMLDSRRLHPVVDCAFRGKVRRREAGFRLSR